MTGYIGTRPQAGAFGARRDGHVRAIGHAARVAGPADRGTQALPRRQFRGVTAVRAQRRQTRIGYAMIGIVVAFLLGLFSLSQTVRVSAMSYDLNDLTSNSQQLDAVSRDLRATLARLGSEPVIRRQAQSSGLTPVLVPLVIQAR